MNIAILGCGWLGWPLGQSLVEKGHYVKGSTTTNNKMQKLREQQVTPYLMKVYAEGIQGDITSFLSEMEVLVINIPPGLRSNPEANFVGKIGRLIPYLEKSSVERVIFVSSTSVYADAEDFPVYTEEDSANGSSETAKQLIASEKTLAENKDFKTDILRFGGLIGPGRHPVNYLTHKSGIRNPKAPVNLIHLDDCIAIIEKIAEKEGPGEIFNAAYPKHPSKEEYYTHMAKERNLAVPEFDQNQPSLGKIISAEKVQKVLDFEFQKEIW
ncbi:MAG: SDR family NAD(P)-dependent oxidoreductase [Salegentibacter sp.]